MCGIFGLVASPTSAVKTDDIKTLVRNLFKLSESRGSEASGIAVAGTSNLQVFRKAQPASRMVRSKEYETFLEEYLQPENQSEGFAVIAHSRLVTNGSQGIDENNQPVISDYCVGVHNGIVVNDRDLWESHHDLQRQSQVDTEIIYRLIDKHYLAKPRQLSLAVKKTYAEMKGEASIAFLHSIERVLCIGTNVGSMYFISAPSLGLFVFASEGYFLKEILKNQLFSMEPNLSVEQLAPNKGRIIAIKDLRESHVDLSDFSNMENETALAKPRKIIDRSPLRKSLMRCTKCVLPHTFPHLRFNSGGVCSFCQEGPPINNDSKITLEAKINKYRSTNGEPDCIVALSGGRDSCYGLHVIKKELGLNPIAYTYDWAMVTDEARRNSARVCGELGVEHIIRSADILSKRRNIRMNIDAWLHRPSLGMIPLFMAGDKQFFHYATQVSKQTGVPLVIFCGGNNLEITRFKTGFCGVEDKSTNTMVGLDQLGKVKLLAYYAKNFLKNPRYLNRSLLDTMFAFYSTYVSRQEFLYLYKYISWDEKVIADTLSKNYGWETSSDSASTWRIGDGTAAFYNYIYHTVAGFSEHDTFRSNQIRAGLITRERALELLAEENKPRYAAMQDYANLVGFSLDEALVVINNIPKLV
jgi:glutamine---fructose-6-phosphate transaminase (isomerizing)